MTAMFACLVRHWPLVQQLTRRAVTGRYRGSVFGIAWTLVVPLFMLAVYTFVFGSVLRVRWGGAQQNNLDFASVLFAGMILHGMLSECLARAPSLITGNVQFVKKVVFPLEILPWVSVLTALFQAAVSLAILVLYLGFTQFELHWTVIFVPVVVLPLLIVALGASWGLAALSVYLRDIGQLIGILITVLLFLSPIFYPIDALPVQLRELIYLNPLTLIVEQLRDVVIWGRPPDAGPLALYYAVALVLALIGYQLFQRLRPGFADVV